MLDKEPTTPAKREPRAALAAMRSPTRPNSRDSLGALIRAYAPPPGFSPNAVLGEGPMEPGIAFVGEQPGDQEDLAGRPFVGPPGRLLARALADAGIDRDACYLTNAVKRFKFGERGKWRLKRTHKLFEIMHDRWWLMEELALVRPRLVVALGATALTALAGRAMPLMKSRGPETFAGDGGPPLPSFVTIHPSYLLRLPDQDAREQRFTRSGCPANP